MKAVYAILTVLVLSLLAGSDHALADGKTSVDSAYKVCYLFDGTDLMSEPCDVSGWGSSVNVRMDISAPEARKLCRQVVGLTREQGWKFDPGWTLKIYSPYSGDRTIAYCNF